MIVPWHKIALAVQVHEMTQSLSELLMASYFVNKLAVPDHENKFNLFQSFLIYEELLLLFKFIR